MMKKIILLLSLVMMIGFASAQQFMIENSTTAHTQGDLGTSNFVDPSGLTRGQSFTIGVSRQNISSYLTNISFPVQTLAAGIGTLRFKAADSDGFPIGSDLSTGTYNFLGTENGWINVSMSSYVMTPGSKYIFYWTNWTTVITTYFNTTNMYSGGKEVRSDNNGSTWSQEGGGTNDLYFEIFSFLSDLVVILDTPAADASIFTPQIFNASLVPVTNSNLTNATLFIWYQNSTIINQTLNTVTGNVTNYTSWNISQLLLGYFDWNVYGCSLINCSFAQTNRTFFAGYKTNSLTYNTTTYETASESFILNGSLSQGLSLTAANLIYNGVSYTGTINTAGPNKIITKTIDVPSISGTKNFYWQLTISGLEFNTTTNAQTVSSIILGRCNSTLIVPYYNFTILEEGTFANLNASLESVLTYWLGSGSVNKSFLYSNLSDTVHNYGFCFSPPNRTLYLDGLTNYYSAGYDSRTYYFSNTSKNNASGNIDLYLLATADSDVVTFTVVDDFLSPVLNAKIRILRWNLVTDTFYLVNEVVTGSGGTASSNLRLNDAFYIFVVSYNGVTYLTTSPEKLASTSKTLQIFLQPTSTIYDTFNDIDYSLSFSNTTNIITFTYNDLSSTIDSGCLRISQLTATGLIILAETCESSPSSTLAYTITSNATYVATGFVTYNSPSGTLYYTLDTLSIELGTATRFTTIQRAAQFISFVFVGTMAMIGVALGSIPIGLGLVVAAAITLNLLGFMNFTFAFIATMISIIIMIILSLGRRYG